MASSMGVFCPQRREDAGMSDETLDEIEALAQSDAGEPFKGALLALVEEVRRLRRQLERWEDYGDAG